MTTSFVKIDNYFILYILNKFDEYRQNTAGLS